MKTSINQVKVLNVSLNFGETPPLPVGRLAYDNGKVLFEYFPEFIQRGLEISPHKLPLKSGTQSFQTHLFEGLPGVFNDSLPDGWGRLLLDRSLRAKGILPDTFTVIDRLAHVGHTGMGALTYAPDFSSSPQSGVINLDELSEQSLEVLSGNSENVFEQLLKLNGSSAGARPKAMIGVSTDKGSIIQGIDNLPKGYEHWIVKFGNTLDGLDSGAIEYVYNQMATKAGILTPETHLFEGRGNAGYFAAKRFDRQNKGQRLHVLTACGLLHSDFRAPTLDYEDLIKATLWLTKDVREAQKIFRYAVFNVLAHNRDDHSKNFSFIMDTKGNWKVSPAYDLTFSSGPRGHQSMLVAGEGENPGIKDLMKLAGHADLSEKETKQIVKQVQHSLSDWSVLANDFGVVPNNINLISGKIN
jgi:serine/threonine-protein kinase HipA